MSEITYRLLCDADIVGQCDRFVIASAMREAVRDNDTLSGFESDLASLCDRINTYARELGSYEAKNYELGLMQSALDGVVFAMAERNNKAIQVLTKQRDHYIAVLGMLRNADVMQAERDLELEKGTQ